MSDNDRTRVHTIPRRGSDRAGTRRVRDQLISEAVVASYIHDISQRSGHWRPARDDHTAVGSSPADGAPEPTTRRPIKLNRRARGSRRDRGLVPVPAGAD